MPRPIPLVEPVTNAVLPCNMMSTPKDELGCLKKPIMALQKLGLSRSAVDCYALS
jgi:hypothetical protein